MDIQDIIPIPIKVSQFIALGVITAMLAVATPLAAQETQAIAIDGSSTVYPITQKIVEEYQTSQKKPINIEVEFSGTGGGFDKCEVGYVPLPDEAYHIDRVTFHKGEVGTVFEGQSQFNLTIPELLRKQARF